MHEKSKQNIRAIFNGFDLFAVEVSSMHSVCFEVEQKPMENLDHGAQKKKKGSAKVRHNAKLNIHLPTHVVAEGHLCRDANAFILALQHYSFTTGDTRTELVWNSKDVKNDIEEFSQHDHTTYHKITWEGNDRTFTLHEAIGISEDEYEEMAGGYNQRRKKGQR
jgi:hypothetical protein